MLYRNDVSARVEIDFDAVRDRNYFRAIWDPEPTSCVLELDGQAFDLCSRDPSKVLADLRRHLWIAHEADMRDQASDEHAESYADAAE